MKFFIIILLSFVPQVAAQSTSPSSTGPTTLPGWFRYYNHQYFNDALPLDTVISEHLKDKRFMAITIYDNDKYHIMFNPKYNFSGKIQRENLLHEMCHEKMMIGQDVMFDEHGAKWQACMRELWDQGALEDLL